MKTGSIRFDFNNLMADRIGRHGIDYGGVEQAGAEVVRAAQWFFTQRGQGKLDFFDLPGHREGLRSALALAAKLKGKFSDLAVLGIGGSALGTAAVHAALNSPHYNHLAKKDRRSLPRLWVLDNVDPEKLKSQLALLDPRKTLVNVVSKSGATAETSAQFLWIRQWLIRSLGGKWATRVVVTTDPGKGLLRQIVASERLMSLAVPPSVGGRFSVLTPVGLFPLAMAGVDVRSLVQGAAAVRERTLNDNPWRNPARLYGLLQYLLYQKGCRINVMMPYSDALYPLADWFRQLWAESLGKRLNARGETVETGPTPVKALGATDQHSQVQLYIEGPRDKTVTFLRVGKFRSDEKIPQAYPEIPDLAYLGGHSFGQLLNYEQRATAMALAKNGRPNCTFEFSEINAHTVGQFIFLMETATAFAGGLFNVDPMDQPGVEQGKRYTYGLMGKQGFEKLAEEVSRFEAGTLEKYIV
jgi:glucose-6-phosphate isomerase